MSRSRNTDAVYPLYDVPGTGFRDREDSAMFNQYHKNGWQATWTADGGVFSNSSPLISPPPLYLSLSSDIRRDFGYVVLCHLIQARDIFDAARAVRSGG